MKLMASWADEMAGLRDRLATYQVLSGSDGRLMHIKIIECRDLKDSDLFSANDVYCMVRPV